MNEKAGMYHVGAPLLLDPPTSSRSGKIESSYADRVAEHGNAKSDAELRITSASTVADGPVDRQEPPATPAQVVERFLNLLRAGDVERAVGLLAEDVEYVNVGLPTVHGRERVRRLFRATLGRANSGFDVYVHAISANGPTVLTERTDVLKARQLYLQLWVCGRFDVHDGQIVLWRDYFDYMAVITATLRGLMGTIFPAARPQPPVPS
jgi:limonene-1,2-epoxide hydrolase